VQAKSQLPSRQFFNGEQALCEVAKEDGVWNWVLVGPDPELLPLSAGGAFGVQEIQESIGEGSQAFGLLRMTFARGSETVTKFLFLHVSGRRGDSSPTAEQRMQAARIEPLMEKALQKFAPFCTKVHLQAPEDFKASFLVSQLRRAPSTGAEELVRAEHLRETCRDALVGWQKAEVLRRLPLPRVEAADESVLEESVVPLLSVAARLQSQPWRQRHKVKLFHVGDMVEVFSSSLQRWYPDGVVVEVATEPARTLSGAVHAGSTKVVYANGLRFKWIPLQDAPDMLRASQLLLPPQPLVGELRKEAHGWFFTRTSSVYVELAAGFLRWWPSRDAARAGGEPTGSLPLLGLESELTGRHFRLRAGGANGAVHAFEVASDAQAEEWADLLFEHAEFLERRIQQAMETEKLKDTVLLEDMRTESMNMKSVASCHRRSTRTVRRGGA